MATHVSMSHGLMVLLLVMALLSCSEARVRTTRQHLELQRHLKRLNKPAIKSIKQLSCRGKFGYRLDVTLFRKYEVRDRILAAASDAATGEVRVIYCTMNGGDIIDCVHISHQPAFDHPLLKNHTIQMRPSFNPFRLYDANKVEKETSSITQLWHQNGRCPKDTIPIRRTRKDDLLRASSIERFGKKSHGAIPNAAPVSNDGHVHEHSFAVANGQHYGTSVFMSVWNPYVHDPLEFSNTQLWLFGGPREFLNTVEAGWHVYPNLYGDNRTRLFTYWTNDRYRQTGCYNLLCSAFVQVSNKVALGSSLKPVSNYDGQQYGILVVVYKDQKTGNWWLQFGNKLDVGYWPASLVKHLPHAAGAAWGAEIINLNKSGDHTSTVMGSGHFGKEGLRKASLCGNIHILDESLNIKQPPEITLIAESPNCYDVVRAPNSEDLGTHFFYGGPGKSPNCP